MLYYKINIIYTFVHCSCKHVHIGVLETVICCFQICELSSAITVNITWIISIRHEIIAVNRMQECHFCTQFSIYLQNHNKEYKVLGAFGHGCKHSCSTKPRLLFTQTDQLLLSLWPDNCQPILSIF